MADQTSNIPDLPTDKDFESALDSRDVLVVVIRTHQLIEATLNLAISESLHEPHHLEIGRLPPSLKVDLGVALGIIRTQDAPALRVVNKLRNAIAHRPGHVFDHKESVNMVNTLSDEQRHLLGAGFDTDRDSLETLRQVLAVLFVSMTTTVERIRDNKLRDEAVGEMVRDRIGHMPRSSSPYQEGVDNELRSRIEEKRQRRKRR